METFASKKKEPPTSADFRDMLLPFTHDESAIKALSSFIDPKDNTISREGMYILEITNNLISSKNGKSFKSNLYQRIPQEVFGGLSEGGRRNVEASLICRAETRADDKEQGKSLASGYTRIQEIIGKWAERDGCWSDTPDTDLLDRGMLHNKYNDGSEAHVFHDSKSKIYKTVDMTHFRDLPKMLDRITLHNATFPETALNIEGFGIREDATDNTGFVVTVSQPFVEGDVPTMEQITRCMEQRGYDKSPDSGYFVSKLDNTAITDVTPVNSVITPEGNLLVFDCDAYLKTFRTEKVSMEQVDMNELLPKNGRYDDKSWEKIFPDGASGVSAQLKSEIVKALRLCGRVDACINGKIIRIADANEKKDRYDGKVIIADRRSIEDEHLYQIPELKYDQKSVDLIVRQIRGLMPESVDLENFLYNDKYVGKDAARVRGGADVRNEYRKELERTGRIAHLVNGEFVVQKDPYKKGNVLISTKENIAFMLFANNNEYPALGRLSSDQKHLLSRGGSIRAADKYIYFNLDRGRLDMSDRSGLRQSQRKGGKEAAMPERTKERPALRM